MDIRNLKPYTLDITRVGWLNRCSPWATAERVPDPMTIRSKRRFFTAAGARDFGHEFERYDFRDGWITKTLVVDTRQH